MSYHPVPLGFFSKIFILSSFIVGCLITIICRQTIVPLSVWTFFQIGGGDVPDETTLICSRGSESALEFLSTCKLANLTVKAELGCCLLHRSGKLIIDCCFLQCESNPLDYLSYAIISTSNCPKVAPSLLKCCNDGVSVSQTRIEGGAKAVLTSGSLALQRVRVIYSQTSIFFWFDVEHQER